jgi:S1-C subfamily serine protease
MGRVTLYSSSNRSRQPLPATARGASTEDRHLSGEPAPSIPASTRRARWRTTLKRFDRPLWLVAGALLVLALVLVHARYAAQPRPLTQDDIDAAVLHTLETKTLPSTAARAYEIIRPSVVRVRQLKEDPDGEKDIEKSVGTGVIIVDKGIILTNLHVVAGADRVGVVFFDGMEAEAEVIGVQPENDLAVIQAKTLPDDMVTATLRSTGDLAPGDEVVAVGFPFGIGPSASAGVISGLGRNYVSPDGKHALANLIQFDAAVNPGSSGGPLVTADGEVVGIVTGIMNPTEQRVFVGIGFAVPIENAAAAIGMSPF